MIVDKRLNNLADAYCRANNREFKYEFYCCLIFYLMILTMGLLI